MARLHSCDLRLHEPREFHQVSEQSQIEFLVNTQDLLDAVISASLSLKSNKRIRYLFQRVEADFYCRMKKFLNTLSDKKPALEIPMQSQDSVFIDKHCDPNSRITELFSPIDNLGSDRYAS
jgi:hypothetical protein